MTDQPDLRVALVTGAASGIGLGIARALRRAGFHVAIADIDGANEAAIAFADAGRVMGVTLDVADPNRWAIAVAQVTDQWGRIDALVNNAGISPRGTPESTEEALWDRTLSINLKGPWLGVRACLPWLKQTHGTIINIGSTRATRPMRGLFVYGVSKAGLLGLTRQVAVEYLADGITCNMVAPGWVDTPGERVIQANYGRPNFPEGVQNLTTSDDVGEAVAYLTTPSGKRVNGVVLYLDSGLHAADDAGMVYLPDIARHRYDQPQHRPDPEA